MIRAALLLLLASCGYGFAVGGPALPAGVGRVYVPVFVNRSVEPDAGALFAEALATSLGQEGRTGDETSDAVIRGEVLAIDAYSVATGPAGTGVGLYRISATVRLALIQKNKELCKRELTAFEEFLPARTLLGLEALRRTALRRLAQTLMANVEYKLCPQMDGK